MNEIAGRYRYLYFEDGGFLAEEINVIRRAPDDHNGPGVHYHAVGDTTGYGWMSLKLLAEHYEKLVS